jgi:hypothetical protein
MSFVTAMMLSRVVHAAEPSAEDRALATELFREGRALLDAGNVPEACEKLAESHRLDPAGGTLLNLALCREKEGRTASAWALYRQARVVAERDRREDRIAFIDEHMRALEPRLSRLSVSASEENVEITVDERPLRRPAWGTQMPVDPGEHAVEARAPNKKPWRRTITVEPDGALENVVVPTLDPKAIEEPPPPPPPLFVTPLPERAPDRTAAVVVGGAGLTAIAIGAVFGVRAIVKHDEASELCTTRPCSLSSVELNDSARTAADVSTAAIAVGVVALGVATYLWLSAPRQARSAQALTLTF